ncbi:hypothetical protein [Mechercharimyces sp. CAU 1602]|uniref:hypothetical protein n=1 Tax=Mechercharimyces sp. CAU 1602 TaxID=2973933 RepID=UPI0021625232|nr:hypothetical protein [Mechercharimyces sp. CAU 1602]MCS1352605.1 hypothetical protein [Mechercharimyces sp. CAU 1602]
MSKINSDKKEVIRKWFDRTYPIIIIACVIMAMWSSNLNWVYSMLAYLCLFGFLQNVIFIRRERGFDLAMSIVGATLTGSATVILLIEIFS